MSVCLSATASNVIVWSQNQHEAANLCVPVLFVSEVNLETGIFFFCISLNGPYFILSCPLEGRRTEVQLVATDTFRQRHYFIQVPQFGFLCRKWLSATSSKAEFRLQVKKKLQSHL